MKVLAAVAAVSVLFAGGCSTNPSAPGTQSERAPSEAAVSPGPDDVAASPSTLTTPSCGKDRAVPEQAGSHLVGGNEPPVPYNSTPPTSGWHSSGAVDIGVAKKPLSEPEQVSVLEAGAAVISYRALPKSDVAALRRLVGSADHEGRVALTRYPKLKAGEVAMTAWGRLQRCDGLDIDAVRDFVAEHVAQDAGRTDH